MTLQRPVFRWLLFAACVALFVAALGWVTLRMLEMEKQNGAAAVDAQLQEKVRLSLWRMDSMVSTLLVRENARPPGHYQPFYAPTDLFSNLSQTALPTGSALKPSPLLGDLPEFVNLHFQLTKTNNTQMCSSPQVPTGNDLTLANNWYAISPQLQASSTRLASLNALLSRHPIVPPSAPVSTASAVPPAPVPAAPKSESPPMAQAIQPEQAKQSPPVSSQSIANAAEFKQRMKISSNFSKDAALEKAPMKKKEVAEGKEERAPATAAAPRPAADGAGASMATATRRNANPQTFAAAKPEPKSTDLQPRWIEDELLLLRSADLDGVIRTQGIWLDWQSLRNSLLDNIRDLLPHAKLTAIDAVGSDASSLVTLPVRLIPGAVSLAAPSSSPLVSSMIIAWCCFAVAAIAVAFLLHRAMQLSERRGAFVSAVTHELRTPLTTFQLYSEMLADDMVPDATRRKEYLQTLCDESTRLTHLVENVLSYSRIERGRTAARKETLPLGQLINRMTPRLEQRAKQVGISINIHMQDEASFATVRLDPLAAEQIIFNLVDNACKYAAPDSRQPMIDLTVIREGRTATILVRDFGPGISKQQLKRLFRPFEKSATEAAHTAPGVGLGLALCRRLAKELGGDLRLCSNRGGACFELTLPVVG